MKSLISSAMFLLGVVLSIQGQQKIDKIGIDKLAAGPSPFCECDSCECVKCNCTPLADHKPVAVSLPSKPEPAVPLVVSPPPDATIEAMQVAAVAEVAETFTHPQPQVLPVAPPPKPQVLPVKQAAPAPVVSGHYEMRQQCGRGGCSMVRVWVPHSNGQQAAPVYQQQYGSCGPGGCGQRRGLFGGRGLFGRRR